MELNIGDKVKYNGNRIIVDIFVWDSLYNRLTTGKEYKIHDIKYRKGKIFYGIFCDDGVVDLYFPKDVFNYLNKKNISKLYNLR